MPHPAPDATHCWRSTPPPAPRPGPPVGCAIAGRRFPPQPAGAKHREGPPSARPRAPPPGPSPGRPSRRSPRFASPPPRPPQESKPFVFGAGSGLGTGGGFGALAAEGGSPAKLAAEGEGGAAAAEGGDEYQEEECQAEYKPVVQLDAVETKTGEEDEEVLYEQKCKLYRYDTESGEWKERGVGPVKLLRSKDNGRTRLLMRQEKVLKIRANHIVMPGTELQEHQGQTKAWVYRTMDFAEEELRPEMFCIRFGSEEKAQDFKKAFDEAAEENGKSMGAPAAAASPAKDAAKEDADALADKLEGAKVEGEAEGEETKADE